MQCRKDFQNVSISNTWIFERCSLITATVCANKFSKILLLRLHQEIIIYDSWAVLPYPCLSQFHTCIQRKFQSDYEKNTIKKIFAFFYISVLINSFTSLDMLPFIMKDKNLLSANKSTSNLFCCCT